MIGGRGASPGEHGKQPEGVNDFDLNPAGLVFFY